MGNFSSVFKELRIRSGLTQNELADNLGISRSAVGMYENGNREPDFETLELIADFFNVDLDYLLGRTNRTTFLKSQSEVTTYDDVELLIARNGKSLSTEQKMRLIKLLSDMDSDY